MNGPRDAIPVLEVGGTHVTAAWVDPDGWQVSQPSRSPLHGDDSGPALVRALADAAAVLGAGAGAAWGIAMPGPFDYHSGVARYAGVGKFEGLAGVDVRSALYELLPQRPGSITFINDASAFLIGEWLIGAAVGAVRATAITLGTGIGSAFLDRGAIVDHGGSVPPDAEVHLLNHAGRPLEDWVSRRALIAAYRKASGHDVKVEPDVDVKGIATLARSGDEVARTVFAQAFAVLGEVLGPWLERFGTDQLVVGGAISGAWDLIERPLLAGLARASDCRFGIALAAEPERSPLVGAAYCAF